MNKKIFLLETTAYPNVLWKVDMLGNKRRLFSFNAAIKKALKWIRYADTVGGQARIVDSTTNKIVWSP